MRYSAGAGDPGVRAVFYLDRRGRIKLPKGNPYLPVVIRSERLRGSSRTATWHRAARRLVDEMRRRGAANLLHLPPDVDDVRPWTWGGFLVAVRYSYVIDLPYDPSLMNRSHRSNAAKASRNGLIVQRTEQIAPVLQCLEATEERTEFSPRISGDELGTAVALLGCDSLRMYVCCDTAGRAASACVVLHAPGARAVGWMAGGRTTVPYEGSSHLLWRAVFDDLASAGAVGIDLCGANIPSVAEFKSRWGARLVPTYSVRPYSVRAAARFLWNWKHSRDVGDPDDAVDRRADGESASNSPVDERRGDHGHLA